MTRREPPSSPPEPDYQSVVRLGAPVKCCRCSMPIHRGDMALMTRYGFECAGGCMSEVGA